MEIISFNNSHSDSCIAENSMVMNSTKTWSPIPSNRDMDIYKLMYNYSVLAIKMFL